MTFPQLELGDARRRLALVGAPPDADDDAVRDRWAAAAWSGIAEPGDGVAGALVGVVGRWDALRIAAGEVQPAFDIDGLVEARSRWRPRLSERAVNDALEMAGHAAARLIIDQDEGWPERLLDLGDHAPRCLWVRGSVDALRPALAVAIVGARAATGYGEHVAIDLAAELAGRGVTVVSGAAYGIDGAAHRAALSSAAPTIAVLAGGVDRAYPTGHTQLLDHIARAGAVVSEVPCGSAPTKWRFLSRNRIIAALSDATVVVEAGWRSGSLNTAGHAAQLGRPLGAVPGPVTSAASAGCHRLLREFDATCITSADDILELLGAYGSASLHGRPTALLSAEPRPEGVTRLLDALSVRTARTVDEIARQSGMAVADVSSQLGLLELDGDVVRGELGWRRVGG